MHKKTKEEEKADEKVDAKEGEGEEAKKEVDPETQAKIDEAMKSHKGLFNGDKVELPKVCKEKIST